MSPTSPLDRLAVETPTCHTWLGDDGLVRQRVKPGAHETLEDARQNLAAVSAVAPDRRPAVLVDLRQMGGIDRRARALYASAEAARGICGVALLVNSPVSRLVGNLFIGLNRTVMPCRLFTDEKEAVAWLRGFLP